MSDTTPKKKLGREIVLDALCDAPDRTMTNAELGNLRGVQAWHQRISNLRDAGYVIASVLLKKGYHGYRLLGRREGSRAAQVTVGKAAALPVLRFDQIATGESQAASEMRDAAERLVKRAPREAAPTADAEAANLTNDVLEAEGLLREALGADTPEGGLVPMARAAAAKLAERPAPRRREAARESAGPALMRKVMEEEGRPMHSKVISERVLAMDGHGYGGKTPAATMAAQLSTSNTKEGVFIRVAPACYGLREWDAATLQLEPVTA